MKPDVIRSRKSNDRKYNDFLKKIKKRQTVF
jgi:hypothetical protein